MHVNLLKLSHKIHTLASRYARSRNSKLALKAVENFYAKEEKLECLKDVAAKIYNETLDSLKKKRHELVDAHAEKAVRISNAKEEIEKYSI